jgi:hypothetical protein
MERQACGYQDICPLANTKRGCFEDIHHEFWPKRHYQTPLEKEFRELDENKVQMCRWEHEDLHRYEQPPEKPSREEMINALASLAVQEA